MSTTHLLKTDLAQIIFEQSKSIGLFAVAYSNPIRIKILLYLEDQGEQTVTDLYIKFRMVQSEMSRHLKILLFQNLVTKEREGKSIYYSIHPKTFEVLNNLSKILDHHVN
jgi:ArsR family transcriptional regulator